MTEARHGLADEHEYRSRFAVGLARVDVSAGDGDGRDLDEDFIVLRLGLCDLGDAEDLGWSVAVVDDGFQLRPFVVAMSASLPAGSASVHHMGANSSRTIRPPAASAALMRPSASSYGTKTATWIAPRPSPRG